MEYKMKGGVVLTDADFERMSNDAAAGNYPGTPGEWVVRPQCDYKPLKVRRLLDLREHKGCR